MDGKSDEGKFHGAFFCLREDFPYLAWNFLQDTGCISNIYSDTG